MDQLEKSIKYVPPYELVERIKAEEKRIRSEAVKIASLKNMEKGLQQGLKKGLELGKLDGLQEGLKQGEAKLKQEKYDMAKKFLAMGLSKEQVADGTGLTIDEINKITNV